MDSCPYYILTIKSTSLSVMISSAAPSIARTYIEYAAAVLIDDANGADAIFAYPLATDAAAYVFCDETDPRFLIPTGAHTPKSAAEFMLTFNARAVLKSKMIRLVLVFWLFTSQDMIPLTLDDNNSGGPDIVTIVISAVPFANATVGTPRVPLATLRV
jgi:hypothetical protein